MYLKGFVAKQPMLSFFILASAGLLLLFMAERMTGVPPEVIQADTRWVALPWLLFCAFFVWRVRIAEHKLWAVLQALAGANPEKGISIESVPLPYGPALVKLMQLVRGGHVEVKEDTQYHFTESGRKWYKGLERWKLGMSEP